MRAALSKISNESDMRTFNIARDNDIPRQRGKLLDALTFLRKHDWQDYKHEKPSEQAISMSEHFVSRFILNKKHADYIQPDGDGAIKFVWEEEEYRTIVTIDGTYLHLSSKRDTGEVTFLNDIAFLNKKRSFIPTEILEYLPNRNTKK